MLVSLSMNFVLIEMTPVLRSNTVNVYKVRLVVVCDISANVYIKPQNGHG